VFFPRTPGRRRLRFSCCAEILAEVERLACGHRTLGNWSLAQICHHLADTQEFCVQDREPEIKTTALYRATIGRFALAVLLWFRFIPEQQGNLSPPGPADLEAAIERLRGATGQIATQPMSAQHPIFGPLTQDQWRRFHLIHAAHHLSFVLPESESS